MKLILLGLLMMIIHKR